MTPEPLQNTIHDSFFLIKTLKRIKKNSVDKIQTPINQFFDKKSNS